MGALLVLAGAAWIVVGHRSSSVPALFTPPVLGGQPAGAVVLAREDHDLAVALALKQQRDGMLLAVATVLGQDGGGAAHLRVTFTLQQTGSAAISAPGASCGAGCYAALVPRHGRPTTMAVTVRGTGAGPSPIVFAMPRVWPAQPAAALVRSAERTYAGLKTLVIHERLGSSPTDVIHSIYREVAPSSLAIDTRGGPQAIVIGDRRWDRQPGGPWLLSAQTPLTAVRPFWFDPVEDATLLGQGRVHGEPAWVVSFADPQIPAFFTVWIEKTSHRTLQLRMTAAAHFMFHTYGPFNAPIRITAPRS